MKENNLDFLRFSLAALVVFSHSFPLLDGTLDTEPLLQATGHLTLGMVAVNWFFVLSGFLITHSWLNSRWTGDYLKKRVLRIFPGFTVATLFCVFVVGPLGVPDVAAYFKAVDLPEFLGMTALLRGYEVPGVFKSLPYPEAVNGSLWTIQYEFWCYLFVALIGILGGLRNRVAPLVLFIGAMLLYAAHLWHGWQVNIGYAEKFLAGPQEWPRLISYFLAGVTFYFWREKIPHSIWIAVACGAGLLVAAAFGMALPFVFPILGTYLLFYLAFSRELPLRKFGRYGDFSYGIYLYSFPIQQLVIQECRWVTNPLTLFLVSLLLTLVAAAFSWYCVEKPFLKLKRRSTGHSAVPQAPKAEPEVVSGAMPKAEVLEEEPAAVG